MISDSRPLCLRAPRRLSVHAVLLVAALNALPAFAQGTGRSLDIQPGGRQNGMGAAGVALFGDPSDALWWNPALLGFADRFSVQINHARLVPGLADDVHHYHAALAVPVGSLAALGASYTYLDYGESEGTDDQGRPTGTFTSSEESGAVAVGVRLLPPVAIGATLKRIQIDLVSGRMTGETYGVDVGAVLRVPLEPLTLGLGFCFQNLGGEVSFTNEDQASPLSRNLKVGASAAFPIAPGEEFSIGGVAVVDYNHSRVTKGFDVWNGGVELQLGTQLVRVAARGGYYFDDLGDIQDFTFGAGLRLWILSVDAGWIPQARNSDLDRVLKLTGGLHVKLWPEGVLASRGASGLP